MPSPIRTPAIDIEEQSLLEQCLGGDRTAFEQLLTPHYAVARSLAGRLLGNLEDAEDAVQDAMLKTYLNLASYQPQRGTLRSWFLRIVYNQCTDARRRAQTRKRYEDLVPVEPPSAPERGLELRESLARVRAAMERLPARQRAALHLRVVEEMEYREIGRVLDLSPQSVRVYVVRARSALREVVGDVVED